MQTAVSSLVTSGALADEATRDESARIELFRRVFLFHGALGHRVGATFDFSESHRLAIVPYVFKFLPIKALLRKKHDELIKPYVYEHLQQLGVRTDEVLVSLVKAVADQYFTSYIRRQDTANRFGLRKRGIADVRAGNPDVYRKMLKMQRDRCAVCGVLFLGSREQTLDHVVPWHLIGDVEDGANWQILCEECNGGKREWFSSLQSAQALNWVYSLENGLLERPTKETRYVVLATARKCSVVECAHNARTSALVVERRFESGLAVVDNVRVLCEHHAPSGR